MFSHGSQNFARLGAGRAGQRPAAAQMAALSSRGWTQLGSSPRHGHKPRNLG